MKTVLIGGMGNVLLGDDGFGPYVIQLLESRYSFSEGVQIVDLGTPALDLTHRISGLDVVILVDCIASDEHKPGTVLVYDKADLFSMVPTQRLDPHSPALSECLLAAEMLGAVPKHVTLLGTIGESFEPGRNLSSAITVSAEKVIEAILRELERQGVAFTEKPHDTEPRIWWQQDPEASICPPV